MASPLLNTKRPGRSQALATPHTFWAPRGRVAGTCVCPLSILVKTDICFSRQMCNLLLEGRKDGGDSKSRDGFQPSSICQQCRKRPAHCFLGKTVSAQAANCLLLMDSVCVFECEPELIMTRLLVLTQLMPRMASGWLRLPNRHIPAFAWHSGTFLANSRQDRNS